MSDLEIETLSIEEGRKIRDFIAKTKQKYLDSPTYVEADCELCQLAKKRLHRDWWDELNGKWDEDEYNQPEDTYYWVMEKELASILRERPEQDGIEILDFAMECLPGILKDYAIAEAMPLSQSDLEGEYREELRRLVATLEGGDLEDAFLEWLYCLDATGDASDYIDIDDGALQVPIEFVLDRLENCEDFLAVDWDWDNLELSKIAMYSEAVILARKEIG